MLSTDFEENYDLMNPSEDAIKEARETKFNPLLLAMLGLTTTDNRNEIAE